MKVKIVIPAKGTSSRVNDKNLRPFFGEKSLLEIFIEKAKRLGMPIVVNSEDDRILQLAKSLGVGTQLRPEELARDETTPSQLARYIAEENSDVDFILYCHCTNPLIDVTRFIPALQIKIEDWKSFDSINTAYFAQKHFFVRGEINGMTNINPLFDREKRPPTQEIKNIFCLEYSMNLISRETMLQLSDFIGRNPAFLFIPHSEVIDIDEEIDFEVAKILYEKQRQASSIPGSRI